ncbi:MAG: XrtA-associated ATPase [Gammaproteobacteria bacterium]|nr:XrtA-associated ATPase [Gammaproteobacteria bacterium]
MYEEYYKLKDKPFQLSPDAKYFFSSKGHDRAMAYLRYGLGQGEGFIVITGGIGTGKTMLLRNLFKELDQDSIIAVEILSTQLKSDDLVIAVAEAFGVSAEAKSKSEILSVLEEFLFNKRQEGYRLLLVVDEAHNLPEETLEELRMLSNYHDDEGALLQSFLLGQVQLKHKLQSAGMEQFRQRIIAGYHLQPLERDEIEQYISYRLTQAGWKDDPLIGKDAFDRIHVATAGVPRRVNRLCERLMLFGALEQLHELESKHVDSVAAEISSELGISPEEELELVPEASDPRASVLQQPAAISTLHQGVSDTTVYELTNRVNQLEAEIRDIKRSIMRNRNLLKAALFDDE